MLTQGRFLISYQIFDNIQVNNIGQTHVREILKDTQPVSAESLLITTTKSNGKYKQRFQPYSNN